MKFGYKEIKEFAENHEDERVRIMYRRLCEARSKSAKWCEEVEKLKEENKQLRIGWCKESEKRQGEWLDSVHKAKYNEVMELLKQLYETDGFVADELILKIERFLYD